MLLSTFIGILVISGQMLVAVETKSGFIERKFPYSKADAEKVLDFLDEVVSQIEGVEEKGIHIGIGGLSDDEALGFIVDAVADLDLRYSIVLPSEIQEAMRTGQMAEPSGRAVALAFRARVERIFKRLPEKKQE